MNWRQRNFCGLNLKVKWYRNKSCHNQRNFHRLIYLLTHFITKNNDCSLYSLIIICEWSINTKLKTANTWVVYYFAALNLLRFRWRMLQQVAHMSYKKLDAKLQTQETALVKISVGNQKACNGLTITDHQSTQLSVLGSCSSSGILQRCILNIIFGAFSCLYKLKWPCEVAS